MTDFIPRSVVLLISIPAGTYIVWFCWMFFYPWRWKTRLLLLAALMACTLPYWLLLKFEGFDGDMRLHYAWRDWSGGPRAEERLGAARLQADPERGDFPQFLGPGRTGEVPAIKLARDWTRTPPREIWRHAIGAGWSSFAIVGELAFTQEQRGGQECVVAYQLVSGEQVWLHSYPARFESPMGGLGPRATPTVADGRIYAVGATGHLACLDAASGRRIWSAEILQGQENIYHGVAPSPLVIEDAGIVVVCPTGPGGPCLAAYDLVTGTRKWHAGQDRASYSSPVVATIGGVRQLLLYNEEAVVSHDLSGNMLWRFPWSNSTKTSVAQPIVVSDENRRVLITSGYGLGAALFAVDSVKAGSVPVIQTLWTSTGMKTKFSSPVRYGDHVYGLDDGILACIALEDGRQLWKRGRYGHGQVLKVGDLLIVLTEAGDLVLVEPHPSGLRELARTPAIQGKTWNNPALAGPYLLVRNSEEAACFKLGLSIHDQR